MSTNGRKQMRYIHISARLATIMQPNGTMQTVVARPGSTFNVGRNAEKRAARAAEAQKRSGIVAVRNRDDFRNASGGQARVSDRKRTPAMLDMLSDRRMRQRSGEGYATRIAEAA